MTNTKTGVTLIETVVYVAIIGVMAVFVINTILTMFFAFSRARDVRRLTLDGSIALERITREIRLASSVEIGESTFGVDPSVLTLNTIESHDNPSPTTRRFYTAGGRIVMEEGGDVQYLVSPRASSTLFYMEHIATPRSHAIKIKFILEADSRNETLSQSFYNTVILRSSY